MTRDDVDVIDQSTAFQGYFRIDRYRLRHRLFEGGWSAEMTREVFERGHAVALLPFDADMDAIVFIEQFRVGAFAALASPWFDADASPWLVECIAGIIDAGETPEEVARREALEEADCAIQELIPMNRYLVSPGGTSQSIFSFCGRVDASAVGGVHGLSQENENIRVLVVPVREALAWLDRGCIVDAMTLLAMQWFRVHHAELKRRWGTTPDGPR